MQGEFIILIQETKIMPNRQDLYKNPNGDYGYLGREPGRWQNVHHPSAQRLVGWPAGRRGPAQPHGRWRSGLGGR